MEKIRKLLICSIAVLGIVSLVGCTMINKGIDTVKSKVTSLKSGKKYSNGEEVRSKIISMINERDESIAAKSKKYYRNEEEAKTKIISMLDEKYKIKFSLAGNESYKKTGAGIVFSTAIKDASGLTATASLAQNKTIPLITAAGSGVPQGLKDTYLKTYYTKKTRDAVEPLFKGEPFTKYYISLDPPQAPVPTPQLDKNTLGLSANNYFSDSGDSYRFEVILPHKNSVKEYADIIFPFYQKLINKQRNPFLLVCYSDNKEVLVEYYIHSKHFYGDKTYAAIVENITDEMAGDQQQPKDEYLGSPYYN